MKLSKDECLLIINGLWKKILQNREDGLSDQSSSTEEHFKLMHRVERYLLDASNFI